MDSRGGYISNILYVKTKEFGPLGGVLRARPLDAPMKNKVYKDLKYLQWESMQAAENHPVLRVSGQVSI